jgi:excisionase family DNA binding protein
MLTVPDAARRVGRNPETVRRWIRSGRLRARKIGTQHLIDERDLDNMAEPRQLSVPGRWRRFDSGRKQPNWVALIHESRRGR